MGSNAHDAEKSPAVNVEGDADVTVAPPETDQPAADAGDDDTDKED